MGEEHEVKEERAGVAGRALVEDWLRAMARAGASDLILRAGHRPAWRVGGELEFIIGPLPGSAALEEAIAGFLDQRRTERWEREGSVDGSVELPGIGRFRMNAYRQRGRPAAEIVEAEGLEQISDEGSLQKGIDEVLAANGILLLLQGFLAYGLDGFAHADVFHRNAHLLTDGHHHAAFGGAVELCQNDPGAAGHFGKVPGLADPVLTGGGV